jgi:hypothetical protein
MWTPLHKAAANCVTSVVEALLRYGADRKAKDVRGNTPYDVAQIFGKFKGEQQLETTLKLLQVTINEGSTETAGATITRGQVLARLKAAMDESDESNRASICIELVHAGASCKRFIKEIILDESIDFYTRRFSLRVGSGFRDADFRNFIHSNLIAGKDKGALIRAYEAGGTDGSEIGLYNTSEEILETPDFFERYVAGTGGQQAVGVTTKRGRRRF